MSGAWASGGVPEDVEVLLYRRAKGTASDEELKARPWQCDIEVSLDEHHHGVADTAAKAMHLALQHWISKGTII